MRIELLTSTEANDAKTALQAEYVTKGIDDTVAAVSAQINRYFVTTIPLGRQAEFEAGDTTKQNNFSLITANARGIEYQGVNFVTAWEAEYAKIYG